MNRRRQDKIVGHFGQVRFAMLKNHLDDVKPENLSALKETIVSSFSSMLNGLEITEEQLGEIVAFLVHFEWIALDGDKVTYPEQK